MLALPTVEPDLESLGARERARAERLRIPEKRRQFIAAQTALRRILARYLGIDAGTVAFGYGAHGKPFLPAAPDLAFNLTHSGRLALVAVTAGADLGIDVEHLVRDRPFLRLARRYFAESEHRWLAALPEPEQRGGFYRTWVLKEAYLKAVGTGLSFPPAGFELAVAESPPRLLRTDRDGDDPAGWSFEILDIGGEYAAALCHRGARRRIVVSGELPR